MCCLMHMSLSVCRLVAIKNEACCVCFYKDLQMVCSVHSVWALLAYRRLHKIFTHVPFAAACRRISINTYLLYCTCVYTWSGHFENIWWHIVHSTWPHQPSKTANFSGENSWDFTVGNVNWFQIRITKFFILTCAIRLPADQGSLNTRKRMKRVCII